MLHSLRWHCKHEEITVYLMNHSLNDSLVRSFETFLDRKCRIALKTIDVKETQMDNLPIVDQNLSIEMYYRILAQFLLPQELDRILWLDADIVVLKDINNFYYQDFEDKLYVVCKDCKNEVFPITLVKEKMGIPADVQYFNSGVMLMNLKILRMQTNCDEILAVCEDMKNRITFPDQDLLNYMYMGKVKYADWYQYNHQLADVKKLKQNELKKISILHYTGKEKPWKPEYYRFLALSYWIAVYRSGKRTEAAKTIARIFERELARSIIGDWYRSVRNLICR